MRTNERIRNEATRRGYRTPPLEMAPLLRASISDEEIAQMGVSGLTVMCDPVNIPFDGRDDSVWLPWMGKSVEGSEISAHSGSPGNPYGGAEGFVFLLPKWLEYLFRRTVEAKPGSPQDKESEDAFEKLRNDGYM
ncbi:MAG: hypothetical protein Q7R93_02190 [bacterium]|nr:hypothetical protein [bacterium]